MRCVNLAISNARNLATRRLISSYASSLQKNSQTAEQSDFPRCVETGQALLAGQQGLHGALLDLALLGDELFQRFDQRIRIAQGLGDGVLFRKGCRGEDKFSNFLQRKTRYRITLHRVLHAPLSLR